MTQRTIQAGPKPIIIIRAGGDVRVAGWESEQVQASTESRWGLKVERRSLSEIARVRAKVGEHVLLDWHVDPQRPENRQEAIEVSLGGSGEVRVPRGSHVKVYSGKNIEVNDIAGSLVAVAPRELTARGINVLGPSSAGRNLDIECQALESDDLKLSAGRDLRLYVRSLNDARLEVADLGGEWVGVIGEGRVRLKLQAGYDVTIVTEHTVVPQPPNYLLGRIEKPTPAEGQ